MTGAAVCPLARCRTVLEHSTDGNGRMIERCPSCERRRRGICHDCPAKVDGAIGKALRCARCRRLAKRAAEKTYLSDPEHRRARAKQYKKYSRQPAVFARRKQQHEAWRKANAAKVKRQKRKYLLKQSPRYLATQRRHNHNPVRAQKKRDAAIAKYYELHPVRPDPHCAKCSVALEWQSGHGRPRETCDNCCTPSELRRRQRGDNTKRSRAA